jgi:hypothetical protein
MSCCAGGGPTGVETAAELHDMFADDLLPRYFPHLRCAMHAQRHPPHPMRGLSACICSTKRERLPGRSRLLWLSVVIMLCTLLGFIECV